jgi:hypothetical protein
MCACGLFQDDTLSSGGHRGASGLAHRCICAWFILRGPSAFQDRRFSLTVCAEAWLVLLRGWSTYCREVVRVVVHSSVSYLAVVSWSLSGVLSAFIGVEWCCFIVTAIGMNGHSLVGCGSAVLFGVGCLWFSARSGFSFCHFGFTSGLFRLGKVRGGFRVSVIYRVTPWCVSDRQVARQGSRWVSVDRSQCRVRL